MVSFWLTEEKPRQSQVELIVGHFGVCEEGVDFDVAGIGFY